MRTLLAFAIVAGLTATAAADDADPKAKAAAEFAEGQKLYDANNYAAAAAKFKAAWALDHDPAYLFNIAQALRFAKQCSEASDYYRKFLAQVTSAPNLDKVHEYLDEVDACAKAQQPQLPPQLQPQPQPPPPEPAHGGSKTWLYTGVAGIALAGLGTMFIYDVHVLNTNHDRVVNDCNMNGCAGGPLKDFDKDYSDRAHLDEKLAAASYVAGGLALAASAFLFVRSRGEEQPPVAISVHDRGAMVTAGWRF